MDMGRYHETLRRQVKDADLLAAILQREAELTREAQISELDRTFALVCASILDYLGEYATKPMLPVIFPKVFGETMSSYFIARYTWGVEREGVKRFSSLPGLSTRISLDGEPSGREESISHLKREAERYLLLGQGLEGTARRANFPAETGPASYPETNDGKITG